MSLRSLVQAPWGQLESLSLFTGASCPFCKSSRICPGLGVMWLPVGDTSGAEWEAFVATQPGFHTLPESKGGMYKLAGAPECDLGDGSIFFQGYGTSKCRAKAQGQCRVEAQPGEPHCVPCHLSLSRRGWELECGSCLVELAVCPEFGVAVDPGGWAGWASGLLLNGRAWETPLQCYLHFTSL